MVKQSWRQARTEKRRARRRKQAAGAGKPKRGGGHFFKVFALGAMIATCALLVLILQWLNPVPPPTLVLVTADGMHTSSPLNAFALADARDVYAQNHILDVSKTDTEPLTFQTLQARIKSLRTLRPSRILLYPWQKTTAILFVNTLGIAIDESIGKQGASDSERTTRPYLVPRDFHAPDFAWKGKDLGLLDVEELLRHVVEMRFDNKIIVFDCQRIHSYFPLDVIQNNFVASVRNLVQGMSSEKKKGLVVLFSCSPSEITSVRAEEGKSVFGYFFNRGIGGAADDATGNRDGRVSLKELHQYVSENVAAWVVKNRCDQQNPILVENGNDCDDIIVAVLSDRTPPEPSESVSFQSDAEMFGELEQEWEDYYRYAMKENPPFEFAPTMWNAYEDNLLRAEQTLIAKDLSKFEQSMINVKHCKDEIELEAKRYFKDLNVKDLEVFSLGLLKTFRLPGYDIFHSAVDSGDPENETNTAGSIEDFIDGKSTLAETATTIEAASAQKNKLPVETHLLRMIIDRRRELGEDGGSDDDIARRILSTISLAERAAAPRSLTTLEVVPWLVGRVESADIVRRLAEDRFLSFGARLVPLNNSIVVNDRSDGAEVYEQVIRTSDVIEKCIRVRTRLLTELRHWVRLAAQRDISPSLENLLKAVDHQAADVHELAPQVRQAVSYRAFRSTVHSNVDRILTELRELDLALRVDATLRDSDERENRIIQAQTHLSALIARREELLSNLYLTAQELSEKRTAAYSALNWQRANQILAIPFPLAADPSEAADLRIKLVRRVQSSVDDEVHVVSSDNSQDDARVAKTSVSDVAVSSAEIMGFLHRLYAFANPELSTIENAPVQQSKRATTAGSSTTLEMLSQRPRNATETDLEAADAACRILHSSQTEWLGPEWPSFQLRDLRLARLFHWHSERMRMNLYAKVGDEQQHYFAAVASAYFAMANSFSSDPQDQRFSENLERLTNAIDKNLLEFPQTKIRFRGVDSEVVELVVRQSKQLPLGLASLRFEAGPSGFALKDVTPQEQSNRILHRLFAVGRQTGAGQVKCGLYFRGHRQSVSVPVVQTDPNSGAASVYRQHQASQGRFTVRLSELANDGVNLLFLLDCSRSMRGIGNADNFDGSRKTKIQIVRDVINRFAEQTPNNSLNVGVRLFGDKVIWKRGDAVTQELARKDTRIVLPIGPFRRGTFRTIIPLLKPKGESPLFQALISAKEDFASVKHGRKEIIVISDGVDNWADFAYKPSITDVANAYRGANIRIHTIAFRTNDDDYSHLGELSKSTGGIPPIRSQDADQLFNHVTGLAGYLRFGVFSGDTRVYPSKPAALASLARSSEYVSLDPGRYHVRVFDHRNAIVSELTNLDLAAGQTREIYFDSRKLKVADETKRQPKVSASDLQSGVELSVFAASRIDRGLKVQLGLSNPNDLNWHPSRIHLRARAVRAAAEERVYSIRAFQPNEYNSSDPSWDFFLEDWPKDADTLQLTATWSKTDSAGIGNTLPIDWNPGIGPTHLDNGILLTRRRFEIANIDGKDQRAVSLTFVFPEDFQDIHHWSVDFVERVLYARQQYDAKDNIYKGTFILQDSSKPDRFILRGPNRDDSQQALTVTVPIAIRRIN